MRSINSQTNLLSIPTNDNYRITVKPVKDECHLLGSCTLFKKQNLGIQNSQRKPITWKKITRPPKRFSMVPTESVTYSSFSERISFLIILTQHLQKLTRIYGYFYITEPMIKLDSDHPISQEMLFNHQSTQKKPLHPIQKANSLQSELEFVRELKRTYRSLFPTIGLGSNKFLNQFITYLFGLQCRNEHKKQNTTATKKSSQIYENSSSTTEKFIDESHQETYPYYNDQRKRFSVKQGSNNYKIEHKISTRSLSIEKKLEKEEADTDSSNKKYPIVSESHLQKQLNGLFRSNIINENARLLPSGNQGTVSMVKIIEDELEQLF